jgi:hypothetical protein
MENYRILRTRKGCVIGGLAGFLLTVLILFLSSKIPPGDSGGGLLLGLPWMVSLLPAWGVYHLTGWDWRVGSVSEVPTHIFWSVVIVNALLCALLGGIAGYGLAVIKKRKRSE